MKTPPLLKEKKPAGINLDGIVKRNRIKKELDEGRIVELEEFSDIYTKEHYAEYKMSGDKNIFESVIDKMMVESCMDDTFKPYINDIKEIINKKLPAHKKRFAILCTLDKNRNLMRKAKVYNNIPVSKMEHVKDYIKILRDYVKVSEVEKKKFGEVMTPIDLVKEMLGKLPREVWSNPKLKWLEPCNGVGPFGIMVIAGLMKGLADWEPDENKRYRHILENMLYVCELQPKNMFLWMCMVDPADRYGLNIYCGSFLDAGFDRHMKEVWGVEKFDVVIGNPPYNDEFSSGNSLWSKFILKAIDTLSVDGYLTKVVPGRWILPGYNIQKGKLRLWDIFNKMNPLCYNIGECSKHFNGVGSDEDYFSYFVIQNSNNEKNTKVICNDGDFIIDTLKTTCLPYKGLNELSTSILTKILSKVEDTFKFVWKYDRTQKDLKDIPTVDNRFPIFVGKDKTGNYKFKYSDHKSDSNDTPKVIFKLGRFIDYYNRLAVDYEGSYGINSAYIYPIKKGENYDYLESNLYKFIGNCFFNGSEITAACYNLLPSQI